MNYEASNINKTGSFVKRLLVAALIALALSGCYPSGDCDVEWQMADNAEWGTVIWDCDVEADGG